MLTPDEVEFEFHPNYELTPIEDSEMDSIAIDWIRGQIIRGNYWAWFEAEVIAKWKDWQGHDYLGCCSYKSEEDFKNSGYFEDMKKQALDDLNKQVERVTNIILNRLGVPTDLYGAPIGAKTDYLRDKGVV